MHYSFHLSFLFLPRTFLSIRIFSFLFLNIISVLSLFQLTIAIHFQLYISFIFLLFVTPSNIFFFLYFTPSSSLHLRTACVTFQFPVTTLRSPTSLSPVHPYIHVFIDRSWTSIDLYFLHKSIFCNLNIVFNNVFGCLVSTKVFSLIVLLWNIDCNWIQCSTTWNGSEGYL